MVQILVYFESWTTRHIVLGWGLVVLCLTVALLSLVFLMFVFHVFLLLLLAMLYFRPSILKKRR